MEGKVVGGPCSRPGIGSCCGRAGLGQQGQSGVPGCGKVNDYGRIHGLVVHGTHRRIHIGGRPIRHDTIPWKGSTHLRAEGVGPGPGAARVACGGGSQRPLSHAGLRMSGASD